MYFSILAPPSGQTVIHVDIILRSLIWDITLLTPTKYHPATHNGYEDIRSQTWYLPQKVEILRTCNFARRLNIGYYSQRGVIWQTYRARYAEEIL